VPNLEGKTLAAAKDSLTDASCTLGKVTKKKSSRKPGIVLSQKPKPGTQLPPESKVAVVVSKT
jgi:beta-lactam-binding protein with PASTA domain